jgi:outer membrane protein TolC
VRYSKFTLNEFVSSQEAEELQLGGATVFEIRLADFAPTAPTASRILGTPVTVWLQHDAREQVDLLRERLELLREIERLHEASYKKGETALTDIIEAKIEVLQAELQLARNDGQRQQIYSRLLEFARRLEATMQKQFASNQSSHADVLKAKAFRLKIEAASRHHAAQRQGDGVGERGQRAAQSAEVYLPDSPGAEERRLEERLLQLDVEEAEAAVEAAKKKEGRVRAARERGDSGATESAVEEAQADLRQKVIDLKRAETQLERFQVRAKRRGAHWGETGGFLVK